MQHTGCLAIRCASLVFACNLAEAVIILMKEGLLFACANASPCTDCIACHSPLAGSRA